MCIPQAAQGVWAVGGAVEGGGGGGGGGSDGGGGGGGGGNDEDWGDEWKAPHDDDAPEEEDVQEFHLPEDGEHAFSELMEAAQESPFLSIAMSILSPRISF